MTEKKSLSYSFTMADRLKDNVFGPEGPFPLKQYDTCRISTGKFPWPKIIYGVPLKLWFPKIGSVLKNES